MQTQIREKIEESLRNLAIEVDGLEYSITYPEVLTFGDFTTNIALVLFSHFGKMKNGKVWGKASSPRELAEKIVVELGSIEDVQKIEVAGPGFINFHLSRTYFSDVLAIVDDDWGKSNTHKDRREIFEYTDPNVFKVFHIGHLMPNVIGESLSRFAKFLGADVRQVNYNGDVGLNIAEALWGLMHNPPLDVRNNNDLGRAYVAGNKAYEENENAKNYQRSSHI